MADHPKNRWAVSPAVWCFAALCAAAILLCLASWLSLAPRQPTFTERYEQATGAATQAEVEAVFRGYPIWVENGDYGQMGDGKSKDRHAVRWVQVAEKQGAVEGDHVADFYFNDSGRLIDSKLHHILH